MNNGSSIVLMVVIIYINCNAASNECKLTGQTAMTACSSWENNKINDIFKTWCNVKTECECNSPCVILECDKSTTPFNCSDQPVVKDRCNASDCEFIFECTDQQKARLITTCKILVVESTSTFSKEPNTTKTPQKTATVTYQASSGSTSNSAVSTTANTAPNTTTSPDRDPPHQGDKSGMAISVTVPVVVIVICAIIAAVLVKRRWKQYQTNMKMHGSSELEPGNSLTITSNGYLDGQIPNIFANEHNPGGNEYAQIADTGSPVKEQANEYQTIDDKIQIKPPGNACYSHVKTQTSVIVDNNYSHIEKRNVDSKITDYGFSYLKRGISALRNSFKKNDESGYDKLELTTVSSDSSRKDDNMAMTELESEYNHIHSGEPVSIKADLQNEKDEYSHLSFKPTSNNSNAKEEVIKDVPCQGTPKFNPVLQPKFGGNETKNAIVIRHDYLELEPVGESGDDSIKDDGQSKFEEINSDGTYGFQYECAKEIDQNENQRNEESETKENQRQNVFQYEFAKRIDSTSDQEIKSAVDKEISGSKETTEVENPNHYYFTLSKT